MVARTRPPTFRVLAAWEPSAPPLPRLVPQVESPGAGPPPSVMVVPRFSFESRLPTLNSPSEPAAPHPPDAEPAPLAPLASPPPPPMLLPRFSFTGRPPAPPPPGEVVVPPAPGAVPAPRARPPSPRLSLLLVPRFPLSGGSTAREISAVPALPAQPAPRARVPGSRLSPLLIPKFPLFPAPTVPESPADTTIRAEPPSEPATEPTPPAPRARPTPETPEAARGSPSQEVDVPAGPAERSPFPAPSVGAAPEQPPASEAHQGLYDLPGLLARIVSASAALKAVGGMQLGARDARPPATLATDVGPSLAGLAAGASELSPDRSPPSEPDVPPAGMLAALPVYHWRDWHRHGRGISASEEGTVAPLPPPDRAFAPRSGGSLVRPKGFLAEFPRMASTCRCPQCHLIDPPAPVRAALARQRHLEYEAESGVSRQKGRTPPAEEDLLPLARPARERWPEYRTRLDFAAYDLP